MKSYRHWSKDERVKLRELVQARTPTKEIARILGRSWGSVYMFMCSRRLRPTPDPRRRKWLPEEDQQLRELRGDGHTLAEIVEIMGRTIHTIDYRAKLLSCRKPLKRFREVEVLCRPHTMEIAAIRLGVSKKSVSKMKAKLKKMGYSIKPAKWYCGGRLVYGPTNAKPQESA